jgi:hypothetical protein
MSKARIKEQPKSDRRDAILGKRMQRTRVGHEKESASCEENQNLAKQKLLGVVY